MSEQKIASKLPESIDARDWAKEFMEMWGNRLSEIDEDLMVTWFANAIMAGHDKALGIKAVCGDEAAYKLRKDKA